MKNTLKAEDYQNAVALINRANINGQEAEYVARLKAELLKYADFLMQIDEPHKPTQAEILDIERG